MAYATSSDFASYLLKAGEPLTDSDDIALATTFLTASQGYIDNYCGRTFEANSDTIGSSDVYKSRLFDADLDVDGLTLFFDRDLSEIGVVTNGNGVAVVSSDYVTEPRNDGPFYAIKLLTSAGLQWEYSSDNNPEDAINTTGIWSYSKSVPADIKHAVLRLSKTLYMQRFTGSVDNDRPIRTSEGLTIMPADMPKDVLRILAPYRRVKVGGV